MATQAALAVAREACERYLETLYPDPEQLPAGFYVVSWPVTGTGARMHSRWFSASQRQALVDFLAEEGQAHNVYMGTAFRSHLCTPAQHRRGGNADIVAIPGVWIEVDHSGGKHAAQNLPDPQTLHDWLMTLPWRWSLLIDSTGGYHCYLVFEQPWVWAVDDTATREAASVLLRRFQASVRALAPADWTIDPTADLSRALRPPGGFNHKYTPPRPVRIISEDAFRITPEALQAASWLVPDPKARGADVHSTGVAEFSLVLAGCAWMRHCRDDATTLPEPQWHGELSIVCRCRDGARLAHTVSMPHPDYSAAETTRKVHYSLDHGGPYLCTQIRADLGGEPYCSACPHWGEIKSPISLGFRASRNGHVPGGEPDTLWTYRELPEPARLDPMLAEGASVWLDAFVDFAQRWSPRGYAGFYEALGCWLLSAVAARRIRVNLGPIAIYPALYLLLIARSSIFAKTTTVEVALALLRQAGLDWLLGDDEATPQAFVRGRTLWVPPNYGELPQSEQDLIKLQLAFAGQRCWYYEEFGQHLEAMMRKDGVMSGFRKLLRQIYDHPLRYRYHTISRGIERLDKPYLALLANSTPADVAPFTGGHSPLWRDGYIARLLISAPADDTPNLDRFPDGEMWHDGKQVVALTAWHERLGSARVELYASDKHEDKYSAQMLTPLPEMVYTLSPEVVEAYYSYDNALRILLAAHNNENLDASYARMPNRALRLALLLASFHEVPGDRTIHLMHWARGQAITERGRLDLHHMIQRVGHERPADTATERRTRQEQRLMAVMRKGDWMSLRDLHSATKIPLADLQGYCDLFVTQGLAESQKTLRTLKYRWQEEREGDDA